MSVFGHNRVEHEKFKKDLRKCLDVNLPETVGTEFDRGSKE